jgi:hypothetical protein
MNFTDPQLQQCYDGNLGAPGNCSEELRQVRALIAVHGFFHHQEGPHSFRVHEVRWRLLLPRLRSGLRHWYQRPDANQDAVSRGLREHLRQMTADSLVVRP